MRISDWSSDVCSSDLARQPQRGAAQDHGKRQAEEKLLQGEVGRPAPLAKNGHPPHLRRVPGGLINRNGGDRPYRCNSGCHIRRSEERRLGNEGVSKVSARVSPCTLQKKKKTNNN